MMLLGRNQVSIARSTRSELGDRSFLVQGSATKADLVVRFSQLGPKEGMHYRVLIPPLNALLVPIPKMT